MAATTSKQTPDVPVVRGDSKPVWCTREPFETLDDCLGFVEQRHPQTETIHTATNIATGDEYECPIPSYLFRGEVGWFDTCLSRRERVRRGHFSGIRGKELDDIGTHVDAALRADLEYLRHPKMLSAGLMQHYGWPTEFIDTTTSLHTASCFSRFGASSSLTQGALAVFNVITLLNNRGTIVDLGEHPIAVRPRLQEAYAVFHPEYRDLKQPQAIKNMGITWYTYRTDPQHRPRITREEELLSVLGDETAGLLRLCVDRAIKDYGKLRHSAAKCLAERIAHCPLIIRRTDGQLVTPREAKIHVNTCTEEHESLRLWSRDYPRSLRREA